MNRDTVRVIYLRVTTTYLWVVISRKTKKRH